MDLGPLEVLYCWQSVLLAIGVATATHGVKRLFDVFAGGKEARKKKIIINRLILPATPILLGAIGAAVVPILPEALIAYSTLHGLVGFKLVLVNAGYGAAVGQFADYVWHRFSGIQADVSQKKAESAAAKAAGGVPTPPASASTLSEPPKGGD